LLCDLRTVTCEPVLIRESLQSGRLSQSNRTIITGMSISPTSHVRTACCQGWGNIIPPHTPIDITKIARITIFMAGQLQLKRQTASTASILWNDSKAFERERLVHPRNMQGITWIVLSGC
jgi:hypothetical protein